MVTGPLAQKDRTGFRYHEKRLMESTSNVTDTVFVGKPDQEHCFLFDADDPLELLRTLLSQAERPETGISREDAYEVMEGMVPERVRST